MNGRERFFLIVLLFFMLGNFLVYFGICYSDYHNARVEANRLKRILDPGIDTSELAVQLGGEINILPELQRLYAENGDMIGWLKMEGTKINYPVMQHQVNNEYYLNHDFYHEDSKMGLPFLDDRCSIQDSDILLVHGHNMKNGFIFGDLKKYKSESYYRSHPRLQFSTLYERREYEIAAVFLSRVYSKSEKTFKYYQFEQADTGDGFDSYVENLKAMALYDTGVPLAYGDKLLLLSTCDYSRKDGRLVVVAREIREG